MGAVLIQPSPLWILPKMPVDPHCSILYSRVKAWAEDIFRYHLPRIVIIGVHQCFCVQICCGFLGPDPRFIFFYFSVLNRTSERKNLSRKTGPWMGHTNWKKSWLLTVCPMTNSVCRVMAVGYRALCNNRQKVRWGYNSEWPGSMEVIATL